MIDVHDAFSNFTKRAFPTVFFQSPIAKASPFSRFIKKNRLIFFHASR